MATTRPAASTTEEIDELPEIEGVDWITREEGIAILDRQARKYLGMSGEEFVRRYRAGELHDDCSEVTRLSMLNVGVAAWKHLGPSLRDRLAAYTRSVGFDPDSLTNTRGHHLPIRAPDAPLVDGNVALVGDAAGFVDPFTGEGMRAAVWSGRAVVDAIDDVLAGRAPDLRGYALAAERQLLPDMAVARQLQDLFHLTPSLYVAIARWFPGVWPRGFRLLQGDLSYTHIKHRLGPGRHAIDLLSDLIRTTPLLQRRAGIQEPYGPERFRIAR